MKESFSEKTKEINRLCINIGLLFPKKTQAESYYGAFCKIYDAYLDIIGNESAQLLQETLN